MARWIRASYAELIFKFVQHEFTSPISIKPLYSKVSEIQLHTLWSCIMVHLLIGVGQYSIPKSRGKGSLQIANLLYIVKVTFTIRYVVLIVTITYFRQEQQWSR